MNACEWTRQIEAYHDGELGAEASRSVEEHLRACPACAAELGRSKALSRRFAEAAFPHPSPDFLLRLRRESPSAQEKVAVALAERLAAAAAAILVICAAWLWSGPAPVQPPTATPAAWELTAVTLDDVQPPAGMSQFAHWVAQDLALEINDD